jgi:hypothetical protein
MLLRLPTPLHLIYLPTLGHQGLELNTQTQARLLQETAKVLLFLLQEMILQLVIPQALLLQHILGVQALVLNMQTQQRHLEELATA